MSVSKDLKNNGACVLKGKDDTIKGRAFLYTRVNVLLHYSYLYSVFFPRRIMNMRTCYG